MTSLLDRRKGLSYDGAITEGRATLSASADLLSPSLGLLDGVNVLEWGQFLSAPLAARMLADIGADVVKLEPLGGDISRRMPPFIGDAPDTESSAFFQHLNLGKRGLSLDVDDPRARDLLHRLLAETDILIESQRPADLRRWGLDYEMLQKRHPHLIVVSITPFGQTGPYSDYAGADLVVWAMSGMAMAHPRSITRADMQPLGLPGYAADNMAASFGAVGATSALMNRVRTGVGSHVDVSALDVLLSVQHVRLSYFDFDGKLDPRTRPAEHLRAVPWGIFPCQDGYVGLFVVVDTQWEGFVRAMGSPDWATVELFKTYVSRAEHGVEILALLKPWLEEHTMQQIFDACQENKVPACAVLAFEDVATNPQFLARRAWRTLDHPTLGNVPVLSPPFHAPGYDWQPARPAPTLGQHNVEVFVDTLGCDPRDPALTIAENQT